MSKRFEMANDTERGKLVYIPTDCIEPHPDNPRKDLGDLTELADSIRQNGILQNLTVVPTEVAGKYTALIGHRRLAAAKLAGLTEVPCVVAEMEYREQLQTMLQENMQRTDLTVYEQARGFQMMLDLGDTVESLAEKSGFSQSTIRRRVKLLDLDEKAFKKSVERGATLADYAELDKLEDPVEKNKVLDHIGTVNFRSELARALDRQKTKKRLDAWRERLSIFATEVKSKDGYVNYEWISTYNDPENYTPPKDADKVEYFFNIDKWGSLYLLKKQEETDTSAEDEERAARQEAAARENARREELKEASARAYHLRAEFVKGVCPADVKEYLSEIMAYWMYLCTTTYVCIDEDDIIATFRLQVYEDENEFECVHLEDCRAATKTPEWALWKMIWMSIGDDENTKYADYWGRYEESRTLDAIYGLLVALGYELSDEEKQLQDGTHPLFKKEDA